MTRDADFDLKDFLPYLLNQAAEVSSVGFQDYYKSKYGMLRTEWRVVFHLGRYEHMTAKEICDRARIHKTKVSRAVAELEKKGFLARRREDKDRRHEALSLTPRGWEVFQDLYEAARDFDRKLAKDMTTAEQRLMRKCLARIADL